jgi:hypothetical protein
MLFKEMSRDLLSKIIEGEEDILSALVARDREIYDSASCPRCGGRCATEVDAQRALKSSRPIPRHNCRCLECKCLFEPFTGILIEMGNLANLEPKIPILSTKD